MTKDVWNWRTWDGEMDVTQWLRDSFSGLLVSGWHWWYIGGGIKCCPCSHYYREEFLSSVAPQIANRAARKPKQGRRPVAIGSLFWGKSQTSLSVWMGARAREAVLGQKWVNSVRLPCHMRTDGICRLVPDTDPWEAARGRLKCKSKTESGIFHPRSPLITGLPLLMKTQSS